jgi:hypothetical protein
MMLISSHWNLVTPASLPEVHHHAAAAVVIPAIYQNVRTMIITQAM